MQGLGTIMQCKVHPNLDDLPMFPENGLDCIRYKIDQKMTYSIAENLATRSPSEGWITLVSRPKNDVVQSCENLATWSDAIGSRLHQWVDVSKWIATLPLTSKHPHHDVARLSLTIHPGPAVIWSFSFENLSHHCYTTVDSRAGNAMCWEISFHVLVKINPNFHKNYF